jgi:hypothetical protein
MVWYDMGLLSFQLSFSWPDKCVGCVLAKNLEKRTLIKQNKFENNF